MYRINILVQSVRIFLMFISECLFYSEFVCLTTLKAKKKIFVKKFSFLQVGIEFVRI